MRASGARRAAAAAAAAGPPSSELSDGHPWMVTARISRLGWGVAAQSTVGTVIQTVEPTLGIGV